MNTIEVITLVVVIAGPLVVALIARSRIAAHGRRLEETQARREQLALDLLAAAGAAARWHRAHGEIATAALLLLQEGTPRAAERLRLALKAHPVEPLQFRRSSEENGAQGMAAHRPSPAVGRGEPAPTGKGTA